MSASFLHGTEVNLDHERVSDLKGRRKGRRKSLLAALSYYARTLIHPGGSNSQQNIHFPSGTGFKQFR